MSRGSYDQGTDPGRGSPRLRRGELGTGAGLDGLLALAVRAPQVPGNGFEYNGLYDGWYHYPREQRIVPQIQGPYYRNYYGGYRVFGLFRHPHGWHDWDKKKFYQGSHFVLDVF